MDKKKIKKLLQDADICFLGYERNGCRDLVSMGLQKLNEAQEELSKSDWVSVEDRKPPKNVVVRVCNKQNPDDLVLAYRTNQETMKIVYPSNVALYSITHWKPIEKLEE